MLRRLVAWLFGFSRDIGEVEERVRRLAWDPAFGMYTRAALIAMSGRELRGRKSVVFLDLRTLDLTFCPIALSMSKGE